MVETTAPVIDRETAEVAAHFERMFRAEVRAADWATGMESEIREFFASQPQAVGSRLLSVDCRDSMCRLRVAHDEADATERFMEAAGHVPPFTNAGARFPDPDPSRSVVYVARRDTRLPWPTRSIPEDDVGATP